MYSEELKYQIGLTLIKGIGNALAKNLIAYIGSVEGIFKEKRQTLVKIPGIGEILAHEIVSQNVLEKAEQEITFIEKNNITPCYYLDKNYPFRLKECPDAPILIYTKGKINLNNGKFVGVVGTRNATDIGKDNCTKLIADISKSVPDIVIVSGLAYGIDICAHKAALDNNMPTIAVLGHGLDRVYPSVHSSLAKKMIENGALITEYLSETNPDKPNFAQRNRIIAGLCDAIAVVESREKGGSLITAQIANDYNRDVFAFPGRVNDETSAGCNHLIKTNQANLIENADDLLQFMNWENQYSKPNKAEQTTLFIDMSDDEQEIIHILRAHAEGLQTNELAIKTGKSFSKVSSLLLTMEFSGWVKSLPGNIYKAII